MTPRFSRSHSTRVSLIPPNPSGGTTASPYTLVEFSTSFFRFAFSRTRIYDPACASAGIPARTSPPQVTPDFAMAAVTMSMAAVTPALVGANKSAFKGTRVAAVAPKKVAGGRATLQVRTPAMRPPAPSPSDGRRPRDDRASAHASRRAPRSKRARVPGVVVASTPRTRGGTGSRDVSKNASHRTDPGSSACRVRERICPGSPRARAEATAGFRRRTPRHAPHSSRRASRASYARSRARDPAHVRARRALRAPRPALYPLAAVWRRGGTRTRRAEPGFPESRASSAKKRKNVSSLFEHRGVFREDGARPHLENPAF